MSFSDSPGLTSQQKRLKLAVPDDVIYKGEPRAGVKIAIKSVINPESELEYYTIRKETDTNMLLAFIEHKSLWIVQESKWHIEL